ncbi:substrate-binding periplasmic protein [Marinobacter sp. DY40_1A1]|uniref:substrate-binding periplasmic protein n=1 Tax=Marinobacter sp. DY40_1A1 TaxID=2583229 RepID=UPI001902D9F2|nr:transporter substrate-binding domain-containing protein [Marinobacter sp. DY40_1A1]MBK1886826.1 transporter substrate-binding domain-containing protein [Marinobacter sp. DY40_1A1]
MNHTQYFLLPWAVRLRKAFAGLVLLLALPASAQTIHLVTEEWPGLIDDTPQGPSGVLWDISRDVLESMGYDVKLDFVPWKRAQRLVSENSRDGIIGIGITDEREKIFRFPEEALLVSETAVYTLKEKGFEYEGLDSLRGMNVGVSPGYVYSSEVRAATHFEQVDMPTIESGLKMLLLGRIDAMLANRNVVRGQGERLGITHQIRASEKPVSGGPVYLVFSPGTSSEFLEAFSQSLKRYKNSGAYAVDGLR